MTDMRDSSGAASPDLQTLSQVSDPLCPPSQDAKTPSLRKPHKAAETVRVAHAGREGSVSTLHTPRRPKLDARLRAAADWVLPCETCADIGCDHGRLGTTLLLEKRCRRLLAADVSAKALQKAIARINAQGLRDQTVFAHANGLDALDALPGGKADTICILGMGGETLAGILMRGKNRLQGARLVLGAQTELPLTREALVKIGYHLQAEQVISSEGRLYILMLATPAPKDVPAYTKREITLGPCFLRELPSTWQPWLLKREKLLASALAAMRQAKTIQQTERLAAVQWELDVTRDALAALAAQADTGGKGHEP